MPSPWRNRSSAQTPASHSPSGRRGEPCSSPRRPPASRALSTRPAAVKQAVCGYGRADKEQVGKMVKAILGLDEIPAPNHAADALAVAICHALAPPLLRVALRSVMTTVMVRVRRPRATGTPGRAASSSQQRARSERSSPTPACARATSSWTSARAAACSRRRCSTAGARVVAVEPDRRLGSRLRRPAGDASSPWTRASFAWPDEPFKVVANLPFAARGGDLPPPASIRPSRSSPPT